MKKEDIVEFLACIGVPKTSIVPSESGWVAAPCPLAPWTHDSGKDTNPSFAVKVNKSGESVFNCFACKYGDLLSLVQEIRSHGVSEPKYRIKDAVTLLMTEQEGGLVLAINDFDEPKELHVDVVWPEDWLASFMYAWKNTKSLAYLKSRDVSKETATALDLRVDTSRWAVCFPIRNWQGLLVGMRGRYIEVGEGQAPYHMYGWAGTRDSLPWYGEHWLSLEKPVLMVESVFDLAAVWPVYKNVVAPLTVGISTEKVLRMQNALDVVTCFDNGSGGDKARMKISKYLGRSVVTHLTPPEGKKDPGEMMEDEVREMLAPWLPLE